MLANTGDSRDAGWTSGWEDPREEVMATHFSILRMQTCDLLCKGFGLGWRDAPL